jgi:spore photoproduct lyase
MEIKYQKTKTIKCKDNGRSSDAVSGNFLLGCGFKEENYFNCLYCYVNRFGRDIVYINENTDEILKECDKWVENQPLIKIPNQIDEKLYYIDISCNTDINLMWNYYDWIYVFDWFKNHKRLAGTFATKYTNDRLLNYNPEGKIRVRMSLMPQVLSDKLEPKTSKILSRIKFAQKLYENQYSSHFNLSPIVYYENWLEDYKELFHIINNETDENFRKQCGLECIFVTYSKMTHKYNIERNIDDSLIWKPELQEDKISQYGGKNIRYKYRIKAKYIEDFKQLLNTELPDCKIRYIF